MAARNNVRNFIYEPSHPSHSFKWFGYRCSVSRVLILRTTYFRRCSDLDYPHTAHSISTRTSSPSTRSGNTSTRWFAGYSDNPVFTWNAHECHGHTTVSPSSHP